MLDIHSVPTLRIEPKASRQLLLFLSAAHFAALLIVLFMPFDLVIKFFVVILVVANLLRLVRLHVFRSSANAIRLVEWDADGEWSLLLANGESLAGQLSPSSYVQTWLVILNFSIGCFVTRSLILTPDTVDQALLRRLRVRLRVGCKQV
ncbi:hypothetical protein MNBD_GAMMA26-1982 [hydrothermal vent metagenome]|uniref:Toxin CptA n=1 Tax=hydrothermal vent metagenome TaxID=652676 RepID=A0A3B1BQL1_9ZZZZ